MGKDQQRGAPGRTRQAGPREALEWLQRRAKDGRQAARMAEHAPSVEYFDSVVIKAELELKQPQTGRGGLLAVLQAAADQGQALLPKVEKAPILETVKRILTALLDQAAAWQRPLN